MVQFITIQCTTDAPDFKYFQQCLLFSISHLVSGNYHILLFIFYYSLSCYNSQKKCNGRSFIIAVHCLAEIFVCLSFKRKNTNADTCNVPIDIQGRRDSIVVVVVIVIVIVVVVVVVHVHACVHTHKYINTYIHA